MNIQFLLKFGKIEHLTELLNVGHVYIKPGDFFKQNIDHGRFDKTEGRQRLQNLKDSYFELRPKGESQWRRLNFQKGKFENWFKISEYFIYSLYYISEDETKENPYFQIPETMKQMGDSYLVINNPKQFMDRIEKRLEKTGFEFNYGIVNYYDETQDQKNLTLFHKPKSFEYQNEFRILLKSNLTVPIEFDIGNLTDIAEIIGINDYTGFHFEWK